MILFDKNVRCCFIIVSGGIEWNDFSESLIDSFRRMSSKRSSKLHSGISILTIQSFLFRIWARNSYLKFNMLEILTIQ